MKKSFEKNIEIAHYDISLKSRIENFRFELEKDNFFVITTRRGLLENKMKSCVSRESLDFLNYENYEWVIKIAEILLYAYLTGPVGQIGVDHWSKLKTSILNLIKGTRSKSLLLIVEIERQKNFSLQLCFVTDRTTKNSNIEALNAIPVTIKNFRHNLDKYKDRRALLVEFKGGVWNVDNPKVLEVNMGSTALSLQRFSKGYGMCEERCFKVKPAETLWEYYNPDVPDKVQREAEKNALNYTVDYYQRLYNSNQIAYALYLSPVQFCMNIFESFLDVSNGIIPIPKIEERKVGNHAVTIISVDTNKKQFTFVNSWGKEWGDLGFGYLSFDYVDNYIIEAWGIRTIYTFKKILRRIFRLRFLLNLVARRERMFNRKDKRLLRADNFIDERKEKIKYSFYEVRPLVPSRGRFFIVDVFDPKIKNKRSAWLHFSFSKNKDTIEIEELYVEEEYQNFGWGSFLLDFVKKEGTHIGIDKIYGWITAEDCFDENEEKKTFHLFEKSGFTLVSDTSKFAGSLYRFEINLKNLPPRVKCDNILPRTES